MIRFAVYRVALEATIEAGGWRLEAGKSRGRLEGCPGCYHRGG